MGERLQLLIVARIFLFWCVTLLGSDFLLCSSLSLMSCSSPTNSHPQISTIPHSPAAALPSAKVLSETAPVDSTLSPFEGISGFFYR